MKLDKLDKCKRFGENVSNHVISWAIFKNNVTLGNSLANKVKMNVNVFGMSVEL